MQRLPTTPQHGHVPVCFESCAPQAAPLSRRPLCQRHSQCHRKGSLDQPKRHCWIQRCLERARRACRKQQTPILHPRCPMLRQAPGSCARLASTYIHHQRCPFEMTIRRTLRWWRTALGSRLGQEQRHRHAPMPLATNELPPRNTHRRRPRRAMEQRLLNRAARRRRCRVHPRGTIPGDLGWVAAKVKEQAPPASATVLK